jgi:hypothetical protein
MQVLARQRRRHSAISKWIFDVVQLENNLKYESWLVFTTIPNHLPIIHHFEAFVKKKAAQT